MTSLLEMFSGYAMVMLFILVFFYPIGAIAEKLLTAWLRKASEGSIDLKGSKIFLNSRLCKWYSKSIDRGPGAVLITVVYVVFYIITMIIYFDGVCDNDFDTIHGASVWFLTGFYNLGVALSGLVTVLAIFTSIHYGVRYTCRIARTAKNALAAVKQHESNYHCNK